nr:hypothetical protein [Leptospira alexanderi]
MGRFDRFSNRFFCKLLPYRTRLCPSLVFDETKSQLVEIDRENNLKISENVSMILSQFNVDLAENKIISKIIVEVTDAILNLWIREQKDKEFSDKIIIELKIILKSYLTRYFPGGQNHLDSDSSF